MKVVLLAGGLGTRMREETEFRPKPMVEVGGRPILWHIMKIFASFGHHEFIICTGYKGEQIRDYFYNFAAHTKDFTTSLNGGSGPIFHGSASDSDWTVTIADTGQETPTGGRIKKVSKYLDDEPFFCTYGDGLASIDLDKLLELHHSEGREATMSITRPSSRFGVVELGGDHEVIGFQEKPVVASLVNMGFFVLEPSVLARLSDTDQFEDAPLRSLAEDRELTAYEHRGFWKPMDTYRESLEFNEMWRSGAAPWRIWGQD